MSKPTIMSNSSWSFRKSKWGVEMQIVKHNTNKVGNTGLCLYHTAIVEADQEPNITEVASECGYHPFFYEMVDQETNKEASGFYKLTWRSTDLP